MVKDKSRPKWIGDMNKPEDDGLNPELISIELELEAELIKIMESPCPTKSFRREGFVNSISTQISKEK